MRRPDVPGRALNALGLLLGAIVLAVGSAGCSQPSGEIDAPSPLPRLTAGPATPLDVERLQAGVGRGGEVSFRSKKDGAGLVIRVVRAEWRESLAATGGTTHEEVLAVAVRLTVIGEAGAGLSLGVPAELEIRSGVTRRSGRFAIAGELSTGELQPGEVREGWLVFEDVDWDELRGTMSPPAARFRMFVSLGEGTGTGEWLVETSLDEQGGSRAVELRGLGASVAYTIL